MSTFLSVKLRGLVGVQTSGVPVPDRSSLNFIGITVTDDPTKNRINIQFMGAEAPTPGTYVIRTEDGSANVNNLYATNAVLCDTLTAAEINCTDNLGAVAAQFSGVVTCNGELDAYGGLNVTGGAEIAGAVLFDNIVEFDDTISAYGGMTVSNALFWANDVQETRALSHQPVLRTGTGWAYSTDIWTNSTLGTILEVPFNPPHGSIINSFTVNYRGAAAHGALPAVMPTIMIGYYDVTTGGSSVVANSTKSDPSANTAAFQAYHSFTSNNAGAGINHTVDRTRHRYYVLVTAESGAFALVGATWDGCLMTWTRPAGSHIGQD